MDSVNAILEATNKQCLCVVLDTTAETGHYNYKAVVHSAPCMGAVAGYLGAFEMLKGWAEKYGKAYFDEQEPTEETPEALVAEFIRRCDTFINDPDFADMLAHITDHGSQLNFFHFSINILPATVA